MKGHENYQRLLDLCKPLSPTPNAIASPCAAASPNRTVEAARLGLPAPVLVGFGMALGLLLGAIPIPLPDLGKLVLGLAGVLIVALVLGKLWRTRGVNWTVPLSASLVLRNLGSRCSLPGRNIFGANVRDNSDADRFGDAASRRAVLVALPLPIMIMVCPSTECRSTSSLLSWQAPAGIRRSSLTRTVSRRRTNQTLAMRRYFRV